jgi:hypothetical protein
MGCHSRAMPATGGEAVVPFELQSGVGFSWQTLDDLAVRQSLAVNMPRFETLFTSDHTVKYYGAMYRKLGIARVPGPY